jgi:hypothetical protein
MVLSILLKLTSVRTADKKVVLLPENLLNLYWHRDHEYSPLGLVKGYAEFPELDSVIHFWLSFWKDEGLKFPKELDPLLIKFIIATESRFRPAVRTKIPENSETGLMQITNKKREGLNGKSKKSQHALRDRFLDLDMVDLTDPVINIDAGIRWPNYKYMNPRRGFPKNLFNMLRGYYDWHNVGEAYAHKVLNLDNASLVERLGRRP